MSMSLRDSDHISLFSLGMKGLPATRIILRYMKRAGNITRRESDWICGHCNWQTTVHCRTSHRYPMSTEMMNIYTGQFINHSIQIERTPRNAINLCTFVSSNGFRRKSSIKVVLLHKPCIVQTPLLTRVVKLDLESSQEARHKLINFK